MLAGIWKGENMDKKVQKIEPKKGYSGFLAIRCAKCGMLNEYCGRRKSDHYRCKCGAVTPLHDLVNVYVYCECRHSAIYRTNVTDPVFDISCIYCGMPVTMQWKKKHRCYQTLKSVG